jgi:hypothetical protein
MGYDTVIYPNPEWKEMKFDMSQIKAWGIKNFLKLYLVFVPVAMDSCFVGADIIVDNLRGIDDILGTVLYDGFGDPISGIRDKYVTNPTDFVLYQNYPNPFNPSTTIRYSIAKAGNIKLKVFDILGREVAILVDGRQNVGGHEAIFNASRLTSGVYVYTLFMDGRLLATHKMILMK